MWTSLTLKGNLWVKLDKSYSRRKPLLSHQQKKPPGVMIVASPEEISMVPQAEKTFGVAKYSFYMRQVAPLAHTSRFTFKWSCHCKKPPCTWQWSHHWKKSLGLRVSGRITGRNFHVCECWVHLFVLYSFYL